MSTSSQSIEPRPGFFQINLNRMPHTLFQVGFSILIFTFLFFTWVDKLQEIIVKNQIERVFSDLNRDLRMIDTFNTIRPRVVAELENYFVQSREEIKETDQFIKDQNKSVLTEVWITVIILFGMCMFGTYIFARRYNVSWTDLLVEGFSVTIALSVVLILFLYLVVNNYDLIDPNVVKKTLVDALLEYGKS